MELRTGEQRQVDSRSLLTSLSCWINQPRAPATKLFVSVVTFPFWSRPGGLVLYLLSKVTSLVWMVTAENAERAWFTEIRDREFQRRLRRRGLEAVSRRSASGFMSRKSHDSPWKCLPFSKVNKQVFTSLISQLGVLQPQTNSQLTGWRTLTCSPWNKGAKLLQRAQVSEPRWERLDGEPVRCCKESLRWKSLLRGKGSSSFLNAMLSVYLMAIPKMF